MAGIGSVSGTGGIGSGRGGDDANTGPLGKLNDVKDVERVPSAMGESGMVFPSGETRGAPDQPAAATVPYSQVYPNYKKAAENALEKEKIPPAYRSRVKDYFSSLQ